jgi:hypothetical protein
MGFSSPQQYEPSLKAMAASGLPAREASHHRSPVAHGLAKGLPVVTAIIPPAVVEPAEPHGVFADEGGIAALVFRLVGGIPREGGVQLDGGLDLGGQVGDEAFAEPVDALGEFEHQVAVRAVPGAGETVEDRVRAGVETGVLPDGEYQPVGAAVGELLEKTPGVEAVDGGVAVAQIGAGLPARTGGNPVDHQAPAAGHPGGAMRGRGRGVRGEHGGVSPANAETADWQ